MASKVKLGYVGVDAGVLMVGDPCYFIGEDAIIDEKCKTWKQACDEVFLTGDALNNADKPLDVYGLGIAIHTTHGDGEYPVYLVTSKSGRRKLVVNLD